MPGKITGKPNQPILAIDYGRKRIGLAVSALSVPCPLESITRTDFKTDIAKISEVINDYSVSEIVIGLPLNMDDTESEMTVEVRNFAAALRNRLKMEIQFTGEKLTSREAEQKLSVTNKNWKKRKGKIDSIAASLILQNFLEKKT